MTSRYDSPVIRYCKKLRIQRDKWVVSRMAAVVVVVVKLMSGGLKSSQWLCLLHNLTI
jgi:hypothetical protein